MAKKSGEKSAALPMAPEGLQVGKLPAVPEIEECVRYYPPNLEAVEDPSAVFRASAALDTHRRIDLFVDVPYCTTICGFCPFNVYPYKDQEAAVYLAALEKEIAAIKERHDFSGIKVATMWIGGGTPSALDEDKLQALLRLLYEQFDLTEAEELTVEIKPTPHQLTGDKLDILTAFGIERISMGVQSIQAGQLKNLGRRQSAADAFEVIEKLKSRGFAVNIDMMYRLPGQKLKDVEADLNGVRRLGIDHMSWFPYVPFPGTQLAGRIDRGLVTEPAGREEYFAMFATVLKYLEDAGYEQYTPYHFALSDRCRYHEGRWRMPQRETLGIGPGAFSFFNGWIYTNEHNPAKYALAVDAHIPPVMIAKQLTDRELVTRLAVLGIKFFDLDMESFRAQSGVSLGEYYADELDLLLRAGLVELGDGRISCTLAGRAFNNDVATIFATDTARRVRHPQAIDLMHAPA